MTELSQDQFEKKKKFNKQHFGSQKKYGFISLRMEPGIAFWILYLVYLINFVDDEYPKAFTPKTKAI